MTKTRFHFAVALGVLACALAAPAYAQDAPPASAAHDDAKSAAAQTGDNQAIIVTGSRIARPELATIQPTQVIGARQIEERGYTNVLQALQSLPGFGPPGNSAVGGQSSFGPAQSFADFLGLGSQRTLTLVNGRRFVSSNSATIFGPTNSGSQVDLNTIPTTLIERIDVVAVGGAPIYGSDAIAGTVNIILKKDFQGVEVGAQYGLSGYGDAPSRRASILVGRNFADGRGNVTVSGEWNKDTGFLGSDRAVSRQNLFFSKPAAGTVTPYAQILYPNRRFVGFTGGGVPFSSDSFSVVSSGIRDAAGTILQFGPTGTLVPLDPGTILPQRYVASGGNGLDTSTYRNLLSSSERYLGTALGSFRFSDHLRAFGEAWYSHNRGVRLTNAPYFSTALFGSAGDFSGNLPADIGNPFLSAADRTTIQSNLPAGQSTFYIGRASTDLTPGLATGLTQTYRLVGGFNGDFTLLDRNFTWEVSANYGRSRTVTHELEMVFQNLLNAIDAVRDTDGTIVCRPGYTSADIATRSSTCAPLNIFGFGQASQAARNYVFADARSVSVNSQLVFNANMQGRLLTLPGGDAKASLGVEHRRERTSFDPGAYFYGDPQPDGSRVQYGSSIPIDPVRGGFHTNEVFGELVLPLVSQETGLRFLKTVEADASARYVDHSISGRDVTWTAGGRLGFVTWLTFRGNYTRAIRNPAITELFNPTSQIFDTAEDPCDARYVNSGPNPARRRANCVAAGITDPAAFQSNVVDFTQPGTTAGNPNLKSEVAKSWTAGIVLQPPVVPGFTFSADWIDINLTQAITSLGGTDLLNACYDATSFPNSFCGSVDRNATGQVTFLREGYYNAASYRLSGLSVIASYLKNFAFGQVGLDINYLYRDRLETRVGTGDLSHSAGGIGYPHHGFTADLNYRRGVGFAQVQAIYVGRSRFDMDEALNSRNITGVGDWYVFNGTIGADIGKTLNLSLIVNNIADRKPPYPFTSTAEATSTYFEGVIGRTFTVAAKITF